jgi:ribokinase
VVSTIGAGDALFSAFLHSYLQARDPLKSLRKAMVYASYKIGAASAADGLLDQTGLDNLYRSVYAVD